MKDEVVVYRVQVHEREHDERKVSKRKIAQGLMELLIEEDIINYSVHENEITGLITVEGQISIIEKGN